MVKPRSSFVRSQVTFNKPATPVHVLVPFIGDELKDLEKLMKMFHSELKDDNNVFLVIILSGGARSKSYELLSGKKDPFQFTKQFIEKTEARTGKSKVSWIMPPYDKTSIIDLITYTVNTVPENSIVFTSTVSTLLNADFISRIRDVTWLGKQAYSPIAFWEYFPSLIYDDQQPRPPTVEVSRYIGHFGELWYDHLAFFAKDYKRGSAAIRNSASEPIDILMSLESYDILRSVDPNLLVRYKPPVCKARAIVEWPRCNLQLLDNVGSGPILAKRLLQDGSIVGMDF